MSRRCAIATTLLATVFGTVLGTVMTLGVAGPAHATHDFRYPSPDGGGGNAPLGGRTIVIDPGHQLGNHNFPRQIDRMVPAGGFRKPCNTTGTATNGGYPEATFTWQVARLLRARLVRLGARVLITRHSNREDRWGPCVNVRGRDGNKQKADLKISIHGDGSFAAGARGFHVIAPTDRRPWTHDIFRPSRRLALDTRRPIAECSSFEHASLIAHHRAPIRYTSVSTPTQMMSSACQNRLQHSTRWRIGCRNPFAAICAVIYTSQIRPAVTCAPCIPTSVKKADRKALRDGAAPSRTMPANSLISMYRNAAPSAKVSRKNRNTGLVRRRSADRAASPQV